MRLLPAVLLCLLSLCPSAASAQEFQGQVVSVKDGDTLVIRDIDGRKMTIRLAEIDAPEHDQPYSRESRSLLNQLAREGGGWLSAHRTDTDRYGRTVATVIRHHDGLNLNHTMVRSGAAWVYHHYLYDKETLPALERAAREEGIGIWSLPQSQRVPPWTWRRHTRR